MKKNQLTTTKSSAVILGKTKSLMNITKKILEGSNKGLVKENARQDLTTHKDITIIGDLMWEKESRKMTWHEAMEYAENLRLGGYDDWRVPALVELEEIIIDGGGIPFSYSGDNTEEGHKIYHENSINESYQLYLQKKGFNSSSLKNYWSSTHKNYDNYNNKRIWCISFNVGNKNIDEKVNINYVRCVRDIHMPSIQKIENRNKVTNPDDYDEEIYKKLKDLRAQIASLKSIPPYIVCSDKSLKDMSNKVPLNKEEMLEVHGIGEVKFERYGEDFLELLQSFKMNTKK